MNAWRKLITVILPELEEAVVIIMMDHTHVPVLELVTSSLHETDKMAFIYLKAKPDCASMIHTG